MHKFVVVAVGVSSIGLLVGLTFLLIMWPVAAPLHPANQTATTTPITTAMNSINGTEPNVDAVIAKWFAPLSPLTLGGVALAASVADTTSERQQGLSGTPYLPTGVVKLFIFDEAGLWGFWMKEMKYPIDIIWLDEHKEVVYIEHYLTPESYPKTVTPPGNAKYVIETKAGFAAANNLTIGTKGEW